MNKELLGFFNLHALPFTKEIPDEKLHTMPTMQRALEMIQLLITVKGIGMLTGKSGSGNYAKCIIM